MFGMRDQQQRQQGETNQLVRVGTVTSVDPATATVRVQVRDQDGLISHALPVIQRKTLKDKDFWLPDIGEHVACLFLPYGQEQGVCLGAIYSRIDTLPEDALDLLGWQFHVDFWRPTAPMAVKRQLVKESIATHRTKGTPESIAAMCALVLGVRPEVRERRYVVAGASRAGDSLCDTGRRGFLAGISLAGVDQCGPPKRPIFVYSLVVGVDEIAPPASDPQAPTRAELGLVAQVMQPARSHHRVRCAPWLAGVAWAGVDVL
jgi:hypothetical protein